MSSLVELIFSAVGVDKAAAEVQSLDTGLRKLGAAHTDVAPAVRSLGSSMQGLSATVRDDLSPAFGAQTQQLLGFAAAALTVRAAYEGFKGAIDDGSNFERLSLRTGDSVRDLVVLDRAFKNAGLSEEYIARSANLLERALGGVNETGGRTEGAFARLGLTIEQLKPLTFTEQLQVLSNAFAKITNQSDKAAIAMQLFGRGGGQMLQLLGDPGAMQLAEEQAGRLADKYQDQARGLNDTEKHLSVVNDRLREMWLAAATQLLPALNSIAKVIGAMNLSGLGTAMGAIGPSLLGGIGAAVLVDKLDLQLLNTAERFGKSLTGVLAEVGSMFTGVLATALPFGLAAGISAQIVLGLVEAWQNSQIQDILDQNKNVHNRVDPYRKGADQALTAADWNKNTAAAQANVDQMQAEERGIRRGGGNKEDRSPEAQARLQVLELAITKAEADIKNIYTNAAVMASTLAKNQADAMTTAMAPLISTLPAMREKDHKNSLEDGDPAQSAMTLQGEQQSLQRQLATPLPAGTSADVAEARQLDLKNKLREVNKELDAVNAKLLEEAHRITEEAKKQNEEEQKRAIYALETEQIKAKASGDSKRVEELKEEIDLARAKMTLTGDDLKLAKDRIQAEHNDWEVERAAAADRQSTETMRIALATQVEGVRAAIAAIDERADETAAQRWSDKKKALDAEIADLKTKLDLETKLAAVDLAAGDQKGADKHNAAANDIRGALAGAKHDEHQIGPDPNSFTANWAVALKKLQGDWAVTAQSMAVSFTSVAESMQAGMAKGIEGMIRHTDNLKQAWFSVTRSLYSSLDSAISQMVSKWIMQHVVMSAADKAWAAVSVGVTAASTASKVAIHAAGEGAQTAASGAGSAARSGISLVETIVHGIHVAVRVATHVAGEAVKTAATLLGAGIRIASVIVESLANIIQAAAGAMAAMASIPYVGPFLALGAAVAIFAAGESLVKGIGKGFSEGGYTGGSEGQVAGVVHGAEFVMSAPAVRAIGKDRLEAIHRAAVGGGSAVGAAAAASMASPTGSGGAKNTHIYLDKSAYLDALKSDMYAVAHEVYTARSRS